ncbi:MAG TPA: DnaB-like helicase N-terminal domain-containing protein, partial [Arenicellales bacterium]|nr:DnaB-like helicase N-terminal domain-containing protein [Arenicellales bacterium]
MQELAYPGAVDAQTESLKLPPHSIEAEQSVLGGLMIDNSAWDTVADLVGEGDFYRHDHRLIFRAISWMADQSTPFDVVTLQEWLADRGELENAGGVAYLGQLARNTPTAANIKAYAEIVRERSIMRQLVQVSTEIGNSAFNPEGRGSAELLDHAETLVFRIAEQGMRGRRGFVGIKDLLVQAVDRIDQLFQQDQPFTGVPTGFNDFDEMTSGLQPSDLVILA